MSASFHPPPAWPSVTLPVEGVADVARRRLQQKGDLFEQGGWWKLRWREDRLERDGTVSRGWSRTVWIGPATGSGRMTER